MRYQLEKEIITIARESLILCIIISESKELLFIHRIYQALLILFIITSYNSKFIIKNPIFSIMHNFRKICILANFSHLR